MTADQLIQRALQGYDVGEQVGRGGCGVVLFGQHRALDRPVAIKQIPPQFATDNEARRRFDAEARLMASIDHPHVVPVYDYVEQDGMCLLVMEYLPGGSVADRFAKEGFDAGSAMAVTLSCAAALEAAHRRGVLHRDVKPGNLMFAANGTVKLTDFGIAKIVGGDDTLMTKAGEIIGTPSYIAPEQARGQQLSPATDIYALATMLYQLLSGVLPFPPTNDSLATLFMHAFEEPTPLLEAAPEVPPPIADVVMRGLATDPSARFDSAEAFGIALAEPSVQCWGADWLAPVGIPVLGADTILAAATGSGRTPDSTPTVRLSQVVRVRQAQKLPRPRVALADVAPTELAPVQEVADFRSPRIPFAIAALLAVAAVVLAIVGLGSPATGGDLAPGTVTVAGIDPVAGGVVDVDLSRPVAVSSPAGTSADLSVVVLDATFAAPVNPYVLAGDLTGEVVVRDGENISGTYRFPIRTTQSALTTAVAVAVVVLALFAAAYIESYIRALRRGRGKLSGSVGLPISAAALAVAAVGAAWVVLGREPTVAALVGCAGLGAAAGVAATVGSMRIGAKYRARRARRRRRR